MFGKQTQGVRKGCFFFIKTPLTCNCLKGTKIRKLADVFLTGEWHFLKVLELIQLALDSRE